MEKKQCELLTRKELDCRTAGLPDCRTAGLPDCRTAGLHYRVFNARLHAFMKKYVNSIAEMRLKVKCMRKVFCD